MTKETRDVLLWLMFLTWAAFCIAGCAYIVFWKGHSGWWFVPAIILATAPNFKEDKEAEEDVDD